MHTILMSQTVGSRRAAEPQRMREIKQTGLNCLLGFIFLELPKRIKRDSVKKRSKNPPRSFSRHESQLELNLKASSRTKHPNTPTPQASK